MTRSALVPAMFLVLVVQGLFACGPGAEGSIPACVPDCAGRACGEGDGCGGTCGECACVPDCAGRACGEGDGCGGTCGECPCVPACAGRACGDDGCGGSCGTCQADTACDAAGACVGPASCPAGGACVETLYVAYLYTCVRDASGLPWAWACTPGSAVGWFPSAAECDMVCTGGESACHEADSQHGAECRACKAACGEGTAYACAAASTGCPAPCACR